MDGSDSRGSVLAALIERADGRSDIKLKFLNRLEEGKFTRDENPTSHFCVYFAAIDPYHKKVFIGHHKKSGLWLFNGGHMDRDELPIEAVIREAKEEWGIPMEPNAITDPKLVTLTEIEHPERQTCEWHYDVWYVLPFDERSFTPLPDHLESEFSDFGWKTYDEAQQLLIDPASHEALTYIRNLA